MDGLRAQMQGVRDVLRSPCRRLNGLTRQYPRATNWIAVFLVLFLVAIALTPHIQGYFAGRYSPLPKHTPQGVHPGQFLVLLWSTAPVHQAAMRMPPRSVLKPDTETRGLTSCMSSDGAVACNVTKDRDLAQKSNVVVFDAESVHSANLPSNRPAEQLWVFWAHGPPRKEPLQDLRETTQLFNYTMGLRQDADIVVPYRKWSPLLQAPSSFVTPSVNKTITAAWIIGECEEEELRHFDGFSPLVSSRWKGSERFMNDILEYVDVKIVPKCGAQLCSSRQGCLSILEKQYFFIFVMESSQCFQNPVQMIYDSLQYYIVPVFFGATDLGASLPPSSFVDTSKLSDSAVVVDALAKLQDSPSLYDDFIKQRRHFQVFDAPSALCSLCDALSGSPKKPLHSDLVTWWQNRTTCPERSAAPLAAPYTDLPADLPGV
ncbi:alpha-(1,3)-fucosyltransferase C-like [Haemaphysalis longicornis]